MVKLQAATCPKCGANIEVNEQLEKTICQYCGTTILVSDAVEKYKVELSGRVEVEGIKNRNDFYDQALKHMDVEEYDEAKECLYTIVNEDPFDVEAYYQIARADYLIAKDYNTYATSNSNFYNDRCQRSVNDLREVYERLHKIDKSSDFEEKTKDFKELLDRDTAAVEDRKIAFDKCGKVLDDIRYYYNEAERILDVDGTIEMGRVILKTLDLSGNFHMMAGDMKEHQSLYWFNSFETITADLIIKAKYYNNSSSDQYNPTYWYDFFRTNTPVTSCEEMDRRHELFVTKAKETIAMLKKRRLKKKLIKSLTTIGIIIGIILLLHYISTH